MPFLTHTYDLISDAPELQILQVHGIYVSQYTSLVTRYQLLDLIEAIINLQNICKILVFIIIYLIVYKHTNFDQDVYHRLQQLSFYYMNQLQRNNWHHYCQKINKQNKNKHVLLNVVGNCRYYISGEEGNIYEIFS